MIRVMIRGDCADDSDTDFADFDRNGITNLKDLARLANVYLSRSGEEE